MIYTVIQFVQIIVILSIVPFGRSGYGIVVPLLLMITLGFTTTGKLSSIDDREAAEAIRGLYIFQCITLLVSVAFNTWHSFRIGHVLVGLLSGLLAPVTIVYALNMFTLMKKRIVDRYGGETSALENKQLELLQWLASLSPMDLAVLSTVVESLGNVFNRVSASQEEQHNADLLAQVVATAEGAGFDVDLSVEDLFRVIMESVPVEQLQAFPAEMPDVEVVARILGIL